MHVVVLGAGIIGLSSAWFLRQAGHTVTLIDRQGGPAQETSFANGAQISVSYAEPWANPSAPLKVLKWLTREDAPLLFRLRAEPQQWLWALSFLRECLPGRLAPNIRAMVALSEYSLSILKRMRTELAIEYDHLERGILNFYTDAASFSESQKAADVMRQYGVNRQIVSVDEVLRIEPALTPQRDKIVGGDFTVGDESGDIYRFCVELAKHAQAQGVECRYHTSVARLLPQGERVAAVEVIDRQGKYETLQADAFVVAMGSYSAELLRPLKVPCLVYPAKGYSATYPIIDPAAAPVVSLSDSQNKIVFSRLGNRLRVAGTAELNGYSRALNDVRCAALTHRTRELFPEVLDFSAVQYWAGLRPSTPSNVPLIGRSRYDNLYLNTGHGTLGWTMGCGSGKAIADIISGQPPEVIFPFIGTGAPPARLAAS